MTELYDRAQALFQARRYADAYPLLLAVLRDRPEDGRARRAAAACLYYLQDWPGAERAYRDILERDPRDVEAAHFLGVALERQGRRAEASGASDAAGLLVGRARQVQTRQVMSRGRTVLYLRFRLQLADGTVRQVEMSGLTISGDIGEGDEVEVRSARQGRDGLLRAASIFDRTTGAAVTSGRGFAGIWSLASTAQGRGLAMAGIVVSVVVFLVIGAVLVAVFRAAGGFPELSGQSPAISLTQASGPPGTSLTVHGSGFQSGETVKVRLLTDQIAEVRADGDGSFDVRAQIPRTFRFTGRFPVTADGQTSARHAAEPFTVT